MFDDVGRVNKIKRIRIDICGIYELNAEFLRGKATAGRRNLVGLHVEARLLKLPRAISPRASEVKKFRGIPTAQRANYLDGIRPIEIGVCKPSRHHVT